MSALRRRNAKTARTRKQSPRAGTKAGGREVSQGDAALARAILDTPMDYVDHEAFHLNGARRRLYGLA